MTRRLYRRRWRRRPRPQYHPGRPVSWIRHRAVPGILLIGCLFALVTVVVLSIRLSPVITVAAMDEINNKVNRIVQDAVSSVVQAQMLEYEDIISLHRDDTGQITSASSNVTAINLLRSELVTQVLDALDGIDLEELDIPIGNLTKLDLLSGRGPALRVQALWIGTIETQMENQFTAAGINQTLHRVMLSIKIPATVLLPTGQVETCVETEFCLAESVIVGSVPSTYIQIEP